MSYGDYNSPDISYRELGRMAKLNGTRWVARHLTEAIRSGKINHRHLSIKALAETCVKDGREWVANMHPKRGGYTALMESGAVQYGDFTNITGQIFFASVKEAYEDEQFVFSKIVPNTATPIADVEKIPGISQIGDQFTDPISEGDDYPQMGVSEDFIHVREKQKRGGLLGVTKEAILFDRTGLLNERCNRMGFYLGLNKEKRLIDTFIDANEAADSIYAGGTRYHWKNTSYAPYQDTSPWINLKTSNPLDDYTSIEAAELLLSAITDPYTGEPIMIEPTHMVVTPDNLHRANRLVSSSEVRAHDSGYPTNATVYETIGPNPMQGRYKVVSSRLLKKRIQAGVDGSTFTGTAAGSWWLANLPKCIEYRYNWDITTQQYGAGTEDEIKRDIVAQYKVSEQGAAAWKEPRLSCKNNAS